MRNGKRSRLGSQAEAGRKRRPLDLPVAIFPVVAAGADPAGREEFPPFGPFPCFRMDGSIATASQANGPNRMPSHVHAVTDRPRLLAVWAVNQAIQTLTANTRNVVMSMFSSRVPLSIM